MYGGGFGFGRVWGRVVCVFGFSGEMGFRFCVFEKDIVDSGKFSIAEGGFVFRAVSCFICRCCL